MRPKTGSGSKWSGSATLIHTADSGKKIYRTCHRSALGACVPASLENCAAHWTDFSAAPRATSAPRPGSCWIFSQLWDLRRGWSQSRWHPPPPLPPPPYWMPEDNRKYFDFGHSSFNNYRYHFCRLSAGSHPRSSVEAGVMQKRVIPRPE